MDAFPSCLAFTLAEEGGWTNDPLDPGGPTMDGLTMPDLLHWDRDATIDDLRNMPGDLVSALYRALYWQPVRGGELWSGLDLLVFDYGVNAGVGTSAMALQRLLRVKTVDGIIGPITAGAARSVFAPRRPVLLSALAEAHRTHYRALGQFPRYGAGWLGRVDRSLAAALQMLAP